MNVDPAYCLMMARYNAWQNRQLAEILEAIPEAGTTRDRGAFFGSILGTLNHLLWGDLIWMSRFDGGAAPAGGIAGSPERHATSPLWRAERAQTDARILDWAGGLDERDLQGGLTWFSGAAGCEVTQPRGALVVHMFNHQTHHRGQVHAMLTGAGHPAPVSDLFLMPEDERWQ